MNTFPPVTPGQRSRALWLSTAAFGVCFAVWVIFSIIGVELKKELGFSDSAFGLLVATPILTGALSRLVLGIWAEMYGGRLIFTLVMLVVAACAFVLPLADSYAMLLLVGLGLGLAGGTFAVGVVYVSAWYPKERQGTALGLFGMGNLGAAVTSFGAPQLLVFLSWREVSVVYGFVTLAMAVIFWLSARPDPATALRAAASRQHASLHERLAPLHNMRVWRFSIYYFLVFGGFVALTSWLPRYYIGSYSLDIQMAGMLTASFAVPAAVFRAIGGMLSDRLGARAVMYIAFGVSIACLFLLSYPDTQYVVSGIHGPIAFTIAPGLAERTIVLFMLGFVMSLGMAAVFKHIPTYYPSHVGAVGGMVGMIGGLGGFFLPIAFGLMNDMIGIWTSCFMLLFGIGVINLAWMHFVIRRMERKHFPQLGSETDLPEIMEAQHARRQERSAENVAGASVGISRALDDG